MLEVFGTKVIPQFDPDPIHSTTRYRQTAQRKYPDFNFPVPDITVAELPDQRHDPAGRHPQAVAAVGRPTRQPSVDAPGRQQVVGGGQRGDEREGVVQDGVGVVLRAARPPRPGARPPGSRG